MMTEDTYRMLCEKARKKFGADLTFERVVDDRVIAGFILETDDGMVYDLSVGTQLELLKKKMVYEEDAI